MTKENQKLADRLWQEKRIHLCTFKGELFLACSSKASETWARENYPHFGIWDYEQGRIVYHAQQSQTA